MNAYEKIRAALALVREPYGTAAHAELQIGLAALAELERAAAEQREWVLVPKYPSREMLKAVEALHSDRHVAMGTALDYWTAMLAAAPPPAPVAHGMFTAEEMDMAYMLGRADRQLPLDAGDAWLTSATRQLVMGRTP